MAAGATAGLQLDVESVLMTLLRVEKIKKIQRRPPAFRREDMPLLVYTKRHIKTGMVDEFKVEFSQHYRRVMERDSSVKAMFAFPDPADNQLYYQVLMSKQASSFGISLELERFYEKGGNVDVYGGWDEDATRAARGHPDVVYRFHHPLSGFMRKDGAGETGIPMFGFMQRTVLPGKAKALGKSFRDVCDLWHNKPGILAATVSQDSDKPNLVHDLRIFANKDGYASHVDKSDPALTSAMEAWFAHYNAAIAFTGELFAADTRDESMHTSSLKKKLKERPKFVTFHFGDADMIGETPVMTRND